MASWDFLVPVGMFGAFAVLSAGILAFAARAQLRVHQKLRELAPRLPLRFTGPAADLEKVPGPERLKPLLQAFFPWRLEGSRGGFEVAAYPETRGSGKSKTSYTVVEAVLNRPVGFPFRAGREPALLSLGKALFKMQDIEVGEKAFDQAVRLQGADAAAIQSLFSDPVLQTAFLGALEKHPSVTLHDTRVRWEVQAVLTDEETYREALDLVVDLAAILEKTAAAQ
ncbi:MAG: hypothetical protein J0L75_20885 [Spirochaetes bacterium]|nr:hypothetical protein [Spirochaetota bacterium]